MRRSCLHGVRFVQLWKHKHTKREGVGVVSCCRALVHLPNAAHCLEEGRQRDRATVAEQSSA